MPDTSIIKVYGTNSCSDCVRSKAFLDQQKVPYQWIDLEQDTAAQEYVRKLNHGRMITPTIVFPDGSFLAEPGNAELARKLKR